MAKKGIAQITGSKVLKLGEVGHYHISKTYRPEDKANISHAKWKLYVKENNNWRELKPVAGTPPKIGSETTITITNQKLLGKELLLEAYLYEPEKSSPPGIVIKIEEGKKKIERVDLFRTDDSSISNSDVLKYGQSIIVKVITVNMPNEKVEITLYEDDENGVGHNANNEKNKVDSVEKRLDHDGFAMHTFKLPIDFQRIANAYMDGSQDKFHEYYINVKSATDSKASSNVNLPNPDYTYPEQEIEEVVIAVKAKEIGVDPLPETGRSVNVVKEVKIEGLLDAYFAKKEYTKQTGEDAGTVEYTFGSNGNKTSTDAEKEKIAKIIVGKSQITSLKNKKEYTTVEAIKTALTATVYNKDQKITIKTFKLGEDFKRVNSAPLEEKLYLVATTSMLDGKEATIIIKEKDGIIKGSAGAVLPVLEITEEQMEQKSNAEEVQGTEKTEFKGTVQDGMVKIPIHLRPKSDDELKQWKDKLAKGKEDGTYTYTFASQTALPNGSGDEKKRVAGAILTNAKEGKRGNPKIETGKTAFADDIEKALVKEVYLAGQTISFPLYKKETEFLYLQAKAQGEKQHDKEFLKQDGAYFQIGGGKCPRCEAEITAHEFKTMFPEASQLFYKGTNSLGNPSIETFLESLNKTLKEFEINTCIKKAFFLTQITKETGYFSRIDENLYYTTETALHNFWSRESHPRLYTNPSEFFRNPEKLGNYVYRNVAENGNESSGDGYKYRGRGLIQITRKRGYRRFGEYSGQDLVTNPDILLQNIDLMTRSAGWYWKHGVLLRNGSEKDLNTVAATGDFKETTRLVHGSTEDVTARESILSKIKNILKTDVCQKSEITSDADIEFHIQSSGEIHYKIQNQKREYAAYFYHDINGNIHNLGKYKLNKVKDNYGGLYSDKLGKDRSNIYLIDIRTVKQSYKSNNLGYSLSINTSRYYMNDVSIASLLGAMIESNYNDLTFNGFSNEKGESVGGSKSHKNGMNGDLRYLRKDKRGGKTDLFNNGEDLGWKGLDEDRQNNFNDLLYKFGWKSMLSQNYGERKNKILRRCTNDSDNNHNDHLHIQGYQPTLKEL